MTARPGSSASTPGTVGKQEHGQVGVFLADAAPGGVALVDRELYLPNSWTEDRGRCRLGGVPDEVDQTSRHRPHGRSSQRLQQPATLNRLARYA